MEAGDRVVGSWVLDIDARQRVFCYSSSSRYERWPPLRKSWLLYERFHMDYVEVAHARVRLCSL